MTNRLACRIATFVLLAASLAGARPRPQSGVGAGGSSESRRAEIERSVDAMPKIDAHAHVMAMGPEQRGQFVSFLARHNFEWLDICTGGLRWDRLRSKMELARGLSREFPDRIHWAPSVNLTNWAQPDWKEASIAALADGFAGGAVAVKFWKEIGMSLRDPDGRYVMIDDPRLAPVFEYIESRDRTVVAHIGEPRNCWLPLAGMTTESDRRYFGGHPEYHGYLHPEIPGYQEQIAARDRVLERHPRLRFVGCHLGSLEYDVDEIARRLDRYPNFAVDLAARMVHLQIQDREKVRAFLVKYQDRLLYATDLEFGSDTGESPDDTAAALARIEQAYRADITWLATDATIDVPRAGPTVRSRGVALPLTVLKKIYRENARKWYRM
jgi:predicted TIM-barrel fold metal-dependent hydrolase